MLKVSVYGLYRYYKKDLEVNKIPHKRLSAFRYSDANCMNLTFCTSLQPQFLADPETFYSASFFVRKNFFKNGFFFKSGFFVQIFPFLNYTIGELIENTNLLENYIFW